MTGGALKKWALDAAERLGLIRLLQLPSGAADSPLFALAYHRVDDPDSASSLGLSNLISATPDQFDAQMRLVASHCRPVSAEDVLNAVDGGKPLPANAVLVTVDDGYRDFQDVIFPIVQRYGIRPVLFVPTAYVGGGVFWWDWLFRAIRMTQTLEIETPLGRRSLHSAAERDRAYEDLSDYVRRQPFEQARREVEALCMSIAPEAQDGARATLDWDELRALARGGVTIASHTHTHPILTHIPVPQARQEMRDSQQIIAREIGQALPIFAFPDGRSHAVNDALLALLREEGYRLAFTMFEGCGRLRRDHPLSLPRVVVSRRRSLTQFHLQLTTAYYVWKQFKP